MSHNNAMFCCCGGGGGGGMVVACFFCRCGPYTACSVAISSNGSNSAVKTEEKTKKDYVLSRFLLGSWESKGLLVDWSASASCMCVCVCV